VQRGVADSGAPGDLDQADAEAVIGECLGCRRQDPIPVLASIAAQTACRPDWRYGHDLSLAD
jgi:hypothetical protein